MRQRISLIEDNAYVLPFGMLEGIAVIADVARCHGEDGMVAAHGDVGAGKPVCAALAEEDVACYDVFIWWKVC